MSPMLLDPQLETTIRETAIRQAKIFRMSPIHICYFAETSTEEVFCCSFDKIKGYRGEQPTEFGLIPGATLRFAADADGNVDWVELQ